MTSEGELGDLDLTEEEIDQMMELGEPVDLAPSAETLEEWPWRS